MHEFILYSQVPASRHEQVLNILAGVTASQPVNISEQCLIYKQLKVATSVVPKKGSARQAPPSQLSHPKLIRQGTAEWKLRMEEVPEPGVKNVISRTVVERDIVEAQLERFEPRSEWNK